MFTASTARKLTRDIRACAGKGEASRGWVEVRPGFEVHVCPLAWARENGYNEVWVRRTRTAEHPHELDFFRGSAEDAAAEILWRIHAAPRLRRYSVSTERTETRTTTTSFEAAASSAVQFAEFDPLVEALEVGQSFTTGGEEGGSVTVRRVA